MSDETAGVRPPAWGSRRHLGGLAWLLIPQSAETAFAAVIAALFVIYAWRLEGTFENIAYTLGVTLALAAIVALVTRRVLFAGAAVGAIAIAVVLASTAKHAIMNMVVHAYDLFFYLSSWSTISFLATEYPGLVAKAAGLAAGLVGLGWLVWRFDRTRVSRTSAAMVGVCGVLLGLYGWAGKGERRHMQFYFQNLYLSSFYASWGETIGTLWHGTLLEAGPRIGASTLTRPTTCVAAEKPPHIVLIHQESLVQPSLFPTLDYDRGVDSLFRGQDGRIQKMRVETYGGASWLTEFSLLAGVSTQSFGGMRQFVQTFMVNKLADTLPQRLAQCGYRNVVFYPMLRNFVSNDKFYASVGLKEIFDLKAQGAASTQERDRFYFGNALKEMERHIASSEQPLFTYIQTMSAHWPYDWTFEPNVTVAGGGPGTHPEINEYLRRVSMAKMDYDELVAGLKKKFPSERILIVQYGDHQPAATRTLIGLKHESDIEDVVVDDNTLGFITYFAMNGINYQVPDVTSDVSPSEAIDVPYLGALIQSAARLPMSPANAERLRLMKACQGRYFNCANRQEILAFHRRLIEGGIIAAR